MMIDVTMLPIPRKKKDRFLTAVGGICLCVVSVTVCAPQSCIEFINPLPWSEITSPLCTVSVKSCPSVSAITFRARYLPDSSSEPVVETIGRITRPPFKLLWDISGIPNQLTSGIICFADAELSNGKKEKIRQEGVFCTHNHCVQPEYTVPFTSFSHINANMPSLHLSLEGTSSTAEVAVAWNTNEIMFQVVVNNPLFYSTLPENKREKIGVTLCLDTGNTRQPFVSKEILIFKIPVEGNPRQINTISEYTSDGAFTIVETVDNCLYSSSVRIENFKGYTVFFAIPLKVFGQTFPRRFSGNVMATVIDEKTDIQELSWVQGNEYVRRSPFAYGIFNIQAKPYLSNPYLVWIIFCVIGAVCGLVLVLFLRITVKFNSLRKFENTELEERILKSIATIIEAEITNKDFTIHDVATRLSVSPAKINRLIKRSFNKTFLKHLQFARIEIVKERLRSSHASEISIAKSCGFPTVDEMEKTFHSLIGTTPYKYREQNRVS